MNIPVIPMEDELYINLDMRGTNIKETECVSHVEFINCNFAGMDLRGVDFMRCTFDSCDLRNAKLNNACLAGVHFFKTNITGTCFINADLEQASMHHMNASYVNFSGAIMIGFKAVSCTFVRTNFKEALLSKAKFNPQPFDVWSGVAYQKSDRYLSKIILLNLSNANFTGADLTDAEFYDYDLEGVKLTRASMIGTKIGSCRLDKANLSYANMQKSRILNSQTVGAVFYLANLRGLFVTNTDMHGANFSKAIFGASLFKDCDLRFTTFTEKSNMQACAFQECQMQNISLVGMKMIGCDFNNSDLTGADLSYSLLNKGDFHKTNLTSVNLSGASLRSAELSQANLTKTMLVGADLTNTCITYIKDSTSAGGE